MGEQRYKVSGADYPGWTILEAIEKTSEAHDALASKRATLRKAFTTEKLVVFGSRRVGKPSRHIDVEALATLDTRDLQSSSLFSEGSLTPEFFEVRIFPVMRAPNAGAYLDGMFISDVFKNFILEDPEVSKLSNRVMRVCGRYESTLRQGESPWFGAEYKWLLGAPSSSLAFAFVASPISFPGQPEKIIPKEITDVAEAITDRLNCLRELLATGRIESEGTYEKTGVLNIIPPSQCRRDDIWLDVRNGDLCSGEDCRPPRWTGIVLKAADLNTEQRKVLVGTDSTEVTTKALALKECTTWLVGIMRLSPNKRSRTKSDLWAEAHIKWGGRLSERGFNKAFASAAETAGAENWQQAGRPKTPQG